MALFQTGAGICGPPPKMRQNETAYWQDVPYTDKFDNEYDSGTYTLTYYFAGPAAAPIQVVATPGTVGASGEGWISTFSAAQAAQMVPGLYGWQAVLTASPPAVPAAVRIVAAEGEITVEQDLSSLTGKYDPRSTWQIILNQCETALQAFAASGNKIRSYRINGREMMFEGVAGIIALERYARGRVSAEQMIGSGGDRRNIRIGFSPPSSGIPTDNSKNWPWW